MANTPYSQGYRRIGKTHGPKQHLAVKVVTKVQMVITDFLLQNRPNGNNF